MERTAPVRRPPSRARPRQPAALVLAYYLLISCLYFVTFISRGGRGGLNGGHLAGQNV